MSKSDQNRWNKKYENKISTLSEMPSEWLIRHEKFLKSQPKGKALDIACGNGRNAIYLAKMGFEVDAVDISDVAINWLKTKGIKENLPIFPKIMDLENEDFPNDNYQIILNFNYLQRSLFPKIIENLAPNGLLFFETFGIDHIEVCESSMNRDYVLGRNELLNAFKELNVLRYEEGVFGNKGRAKLLGRKYAKF